MDWSIVPKEEPEWFKYLTILQLDPTYPVDPGVIPKEEPVWVKPLLDYMVEKARTFDAAISAQIASGKVKRSGIERDDMAGLPFVESVEVHKSHFTVGTDEDGAGQPPDANNT